MLIKIKVIGGDKMEKTFIFGHKNPDTDSVCSAVVMKTYKNT